MNGNGMASGPLLAALSVLLLGCDLSSGRTATESTPVPEADRPTTPHEADAQREDLDAFVRGFFEVDPSYSPAARAEARSRILELTRNAGAVPDVEFVLRLSQITALADNAHTSVVRPEALEGWQRVGIRLAVFGEDIVVIRAIAEHADLLGGRLMAIDGTPIDSLRATARTLTGGVPAHRDLMAPPFLESPGELHALGIARDSREATYAFEMPDRGKREATLGVVWDATPGSLSPEGVPEGWRTLLPGKKAPWALREMDKTMRRLDLPALQATLIQLRGNRDGDQPIAEFLKAAEGARRRAGRRNVILDMRINSGGDLTTTREWMTALPSRLPKSGRVVILTSPATFSAAIASVGYVKQAGGSRVILAGEAPGDRLNFFAEGRPIVLPNSRATILVATERHDYATGCKGYRDCHEQVVRFPIEVESLEPDVKAPWTLEAYRKGRDPGMEAAAKVLRRRR